MNHNKKLLLFFLGTILCHNVLAQNNSENKRPNILLIIVDDLGWADLGCFGADLHETPNIDAFAATGQKFTNAYAAASICSPTRASLLSGKSPARLNMTIWREAAINSQFNKKLIPPDVSSNLPLDEVTIAEALKAEGYVTAHLGKWHVGDGEHFPETQGFDINVGATVWGSPPTFFYPYRGEIYNSLRFVPDLERDKNGTYNLDREGEYLGDRLTDEAISIMERFKNESFFINLAYYTVHTPIEAKADIVKYYEKKLRSGMSHQNAIFAAMVHSLDENIGRLMKKLEELDLADNTAVVFTSDNGGFINEWEGKSVTSNFPLRSGKGALYEGGIRIPTIIRWPGMTTPNTTSDYPITTQDFYPTLLEMVNLEGDPGQVAAFDGISLVPVLKDPQADFKQRELYWHYPHYYQTTTPVSAIRQGDWKLLEFLEDNHVELYNLKENIGETINLAKSNPKKTKELLQLLTAWRENVNAPMPRPNPEYPKNRK
ncbi:MAG: sulfatase [Verrucomicrobia bacterium]|nr:sulfatase [Verrucomicrobiota bacterium]MDA1069191.1 sulfatase [Verrucomicrobiota bacterium]